jgi:hypothetical protein
VFGRLASDVSKIVSISFSTSCIAVDGENDFIFHYVFSPPADCFDRYQKIDSVVTTDI